MAHIESVEQAMVRLEHAGERRERTIKKAQGDEGRVRRAGYHYLRTVRNARLQVRYNGALPRLERGILGTAGSPEEVKRYQELAKLVGKQANEPLVLVEGVSRDGSGRVQQALVGEVDGPLQVHASFLGKGIPREIADPRQGATLVIPTTPMMRFYRDEEDWRIRGVEDNGTHLEVASIALDEADNASGDPDRDATVYEAGVEQGLLVGEEAIRGSQLFEPDLKAILALAGHPISK